jgi:FKBP-type peptidyl-prolyl cis-trans isomerase (trigger factor)
MSIIEQKQPSLQEEFIEHVQSLSDIREVLKKDILRQLENRGSSDSTVSNLVNPVESVLPKESFQNFVVIG